ncbi:alpha/beta hydrolase family protein [Cloacibacterium caeni]|uniref:alpha/beta hydrolase family protein n=1 Tax=Cloacibacterium caeni TaxID=2004710 RepID=UPI001BCEC075|nr:alpha/beta fold hydrolase [Cloacibacterium caeni]
MKTLISMVLILLAQTFYAQEIIGPWQGELDIQGMKLPLILHVNKDGENLKSTLDSPKQGAKDLPVSKTEFVNNELKFEATNLGVSYKGTLKDGKIEGTFSQGGMQLPLTFVKSTGENKTVFNRPQTPKEPFDYKTEEVTFVNPIDKNTLAGTISIPKNFKNSDKILVMITGSGKQNRDEELFGHKPFAVIADDFAKKGIATLRLDDRGIGGSSKGKDDDTSANYATDISTAVDFLVKKGYKNIGLIGHSEGGMIAPIVSTTNKNVKFLVLMAGPGTQLDELLLKQNESAGKLAGMSDKDLAEAKIGNQKIYNFIKNYKGNNYETDLKNFMTENFKGKMTDAEINQTVNQTKKNWFRYFIKFNPDHYLSKIKIPVLALNGSKDFQVPAKDNLAAIKKSLTKAGNKNFEIAEMEGLNHLFQECKTGAFSEYADIEQTISPKVLEKMSSWILKRK